MNPYSTSVTRLYDILGISGNDRQNTVFAMYKEKCLYVKDRNNDINELNTKCTELRYQYANLQCENRELVNLCKKTGLDAAAFRDIITMMVNEWKEETDIKKKQYCEENGIMLLQIPF